MKYISENTCLLLSSENLISSTVFNPDFIKYYVENKPFKKEDNTTIFEKKYCIVAGKNGTIVEIGFYDIQIAGLVKEYIDSLVVKNEPYIIIPSNEYFLKKLN